VGWQREFSSSAGSAALPEYGMYLAMLEAATDCALVYRKERRAQRDCEVCDGARV